MILKKAEKSKIEKKEGEKKSLSESEIKKKRSIEEVVAGTSKSINEAKKVKSIQDDPNASEVFKSLFNSCPKAKNQQKAHWVTFNPQYF